MWCMGTNKRVPADATTFAAGTMDFALGRKERIGQPPPMCQMAPCSNSPFKPTIAPFPYA